MICRNGCVMLIRRVPGFNLRGDDSGLTKDVRSGGHKRTTRVDKRPQGRTKRPRKSTKLKCPPLSRSQADTSGHRRSRPFIQFQPVGLAWESTRSDMYSCYTLIIPLSKRAAIFVQYGLYNMPYKPKTTRFGWFKWSKWRDSNPRPFGPEPNALPNCATPRGADNGTRTHDLMITNQPLYQLSYIGMPRFERAIDYSTVAGKMQARI